MPSSKNPTTKKRTQFNVEGISEGSIELINRLKVHYGWTSAEMLETLVVEEAKRAGIYQGVTEDSKGEQVLEAGHH